MGNTPTRASFRWRPSALRSISSARSTSHRFVLLVRDLTEIDASLAALGGDERLRAREIDLLRFQVGELDAAGIDDPDEDAALDAEESLLADAAAHREAGAAAYEALAADDGARDALGRALAAVDGRAPFRRGRNAAARPARRTR